MSYQNSPKKFAVTKDMVVTTSQITASGLHRNVLRDLVDRGEVYRVSRGIYLSPDSWEDDFLLLQYRFKSGIYSHETALYLHGYSDRTPAIYTMTFLKGYNAKSLKNELLKAVRVVPSNYAFGISEVKSPCGNPLRVYDLERTLCDLLRGNKYDIEIVNPAMKKYTSSSHMNIDKLLQYAKILKVTSKVLHYLEVLL